MVHTPRPHLPGSRPKATLEIIPDFQFIVFNGTEHEATPVKLSGIVRFTAPEAMSILKPKVRLEGKRKMSQNRTGEDRAGVVLGLAASDRPTDRAVAELIPNSAS